MLLRTVPVIAMAPLIIRIFGRDVATVALVAGVVVLPPGAGEHRLRESSRP
jgi:ABC-type nitrate/sulfonate/bicarbonate transport system permease component